MIKKLHALWISFLFVMTLPVEAAEGLIAIKSPLSPKETMDRLEQIVEQKHMKVFARIDHAAAAREVGESLRPTEVLIFGNPRVGTKFMGCSQTVGIDLPLKILVWMDASGQVWLGYEDPDALAARHGIAQCPVVRRISKALAEFTEETVAQEHSRRGRRSREQSSQPASRQDISE
ncbi:MAG: DUF302 domain-containing protein [Gammaproteobacteria bacterium]|nr:DUF302 domain-containing protein [Gammaproteobacteria bacterium]HRX70316.1 DUF302 domain-containing protein [Candidatus Competibacteraceae bacterium]